MERAENAGVQRALAAAAAAATLAAAVVVLEVTAKVAEAL